MSSLAQQMVDVGYAKGCGRLSERMLKEVILNSANSVAAPPAPTGFTATQQPNGDIVVNWDLPGSTVTNTKVWTSTDNITYVLNSTIPAPGITVTIPNPGTDIYIKIQWCNSSGVCGPFTTVDFVGFLPPAVTGFVYASNVAFTFVVAGWNAPVVGVTATEIWTSADNVTFALAQTINAPGTSANVAIPAIGSTTYAKVRWITASAQGPFTSVLLFTHTDWETRAFNNSALAVLASSKSIQNNFYSALSTAGLLSKILTANLFDNQHGNAPQTRTPIVNTAGSDPWGTDNFGDADCTGNGIVSGGAASVIPSTNASTLFGSDTNAGFTCYAFTSASEVNLYDLGYTNNAGTLALALQVNNGGNTKTKIWNDTSVISIACPGSGYYSANRVGATDFKLYFANSGTAHAQVGSSAAASGTRQAQQINGLSVRAYELAQNILWTGHTLSFMAFHQGLTSAESAALFTVVQAALVYSGGGFV